MISTDTPSPNAFTEVTTDKAYPLTFAQESLYFLDQLTRGEPVYNMPKAFRVSGPLKMASLEKALRWVYERHDGLRMTVQDAGEPSQRPEPPNALCFRVHQVRSDRLTRALAHAVREPFDLWKGPLFRADVFRLSESESVILFNLHHIVGDMSSLAILFSEISTAYAAFSSGANPDAESIPVQLGEFAAASRKKEVAPETLDFWRRNLQGHTAELEIAADRFRPKYPSFRGAAYYFDLPSATRNGLAELARKSKSSLYMVCLAALQGLIFRYTAQSRFAIGTPFTSRTDPDLERTIGYLVNLLPIACRVTPEKTFRELVAEVRAQCLEVYAHADVSFRDITRELGLASENPKPPLARVVFQYFPEIARLELAGLNCEEIRVHTGTSKFDLCVSMAEEASTITTEIEYDTDIFDEETIRRVATHFQNLLRAAVENPDRQIGEIQLMDREEEERIAQWSAPTSDFPREATVHGLFEEHVARNPDKTALAFDGGEWSYAQLNVVANGIAANLRASGVQPGDFVGVCLQRSPDLIAALIGILKAGAAFVPFEASYPKARLDYLFADSSVRLLVTDAKHATVAPDGVTILRVDTDAGASIGDAPEVGTADSVAYMMYTSGSTGNPKGTLIPHRAIVRLVKGNDFASFRPDEVFLAFAPVSFDASTLEIWGALLNGATLAIYPPQFESVEQFEEVLQRHQVTILWLTAGLFNTVVDRKVEALRGVRQLLVGGDVLSVTHVRKALDALPETTLINGYGPTENTTFTCCYRIPRDFPAGRSVPIGRPIRNTSVYLLDERLQRVPIGVPGDLYAGGDGLSLGYWNKPELTKTSFRPNPFQPDGRLYKTGDRARFLADGNVEFLGRRDTQVKIRGFRIEVEEVEGALRRLPAVQDAAVVAHADSSGSKSLVGYVVLQTGCTTTPSEIIAEVEQHLPAHACPSRIILLPELPLNPNGKVNRAALPEPGEVNRTDADVVRPTNEIEEKLIQLWRQVLEVPQIGIDDNFFLLGGESLRATRAISQINASFNCRLSLPRIFEAPTVRQMARLVQSARGGEEAVRSGPKAVPDDIPDVSRLSEQDVDAMLAELLASDEGTKK